jgi:hypothetical protein
LPQCNDIADYDALYAYRNRAASKTSALRLDEVALRMQVIISVSGRHEAGQTWQDCYRSAFTN